MLFWYIATGSIVFTQCFLDKAQINKGSLLSIDVDSLSYSSLTSFYLIAPFAVYSERTSMALPGCCIDSSKDINLPGNGQKEVKSRTVVVDRLTLAKFVPSFVR